MKKSKIRIKVKPKKTTAESRTLKIKPKISFGTSNINLEYYVISADFLPNCPLLEEPSETSDLLNQKNELNVEAEIVFNLANPAPIDPMFVDYHSSPNSVISQKFASVISSFNIEGLQLIPSVIIDNDGTSYENYYTIHIYNYIDCIDNSRSTIEIDNSTNSISIKKIRFNSVMLNKMHLQNRLIFRIKEAPYLKIYHRSVVEAIMGSKFIGVKFYTVKDWYDGINFDSFLRSKN